MQARGWIVLNSVGVVGGMLWLFRTVVSAAEKLLDPWGMAGRLFDVVQYAGKDGLNGVGARGTEYPILAFASFPSDIDLAIPSTLVHAPETFPRAKKLDSPKIPAVGSCFCFGENFFRLCPIETRHYSHTVNSCFLYRCCPN